MKNNKNTAGIRAMLVIMPMLLIGVTSLKANEMILVEDYTADTVKVPKTPDTTLASVEFTLDRDAMVSLSTGGLVQYESEYHNSSGWTMVPENISWVTMNGSKLDYSMGSPQLNANYFLALPAGHHKFQLKVNTSDFHVPVYADNMTYVFNPRIQALIILSDTTQGYVAENPRNDDDNPLPKATIASGPTIRVPGCNKVVDITGRTVNVTISNDEVMVKDLPRGTYFITGNKQNIKIVKM